MAPLASGVPWAHPAALGSLAKVVDRALWVPQARRGPRENGVLRAPLERMESQGPPGFRAPLELLGPWAKMVTREKWVPRATRAAEATREMRAHRDRQA